jgi:superfamily II DNA/RNA helicase
MMFSGNISNEIRNICKKFAINPFETFTGEYDRTTNERFTFYNLIRYNENKVDILLEILNIFMTKKIVIFVNNIDTCKDLDTKLKDEEIYNFVAVHFSLTQDERYNIIIVE